MIYFNEETRSFGITDGLKTVGQKISDTSRIMGARARMANTAKNAGRVGALGNVLLNKAKRNNLEKQYISQGKTPEEAKALAKANTRSDVGAAIVGNIAGRTVRHGANAAGGLLGFQMKATNRDKTLVKGLHSAKIQNDKQRVLDIINRKRN